jgi:hypothetical protein
VPLARVQSMSRSLPFDLVASGHACMLSTPGSRRTLARSHPLQVPKGLTETRRARPRSRMGQTSVRRTAPLGPEGPRDGLERGRVSPKSPRVRARTTSAGPEDPTEMSRSPVVAASRLARLPSARAPKSPCGERRVASGYDGPFSPSTPPPDSEEPLVGIDDHHGRSHVLRGERGWTSGRSEEPPGAVSRPVRNRSDRRPGARPPTSRRTPAPCSRTRPRSWSRGPRRTLAPCSRARLRADLEDPEGPSRPALELARTPAPASRRTLAPCSRTAPPGGPAPLASEATPRPEGRRAARPDVR